MKSNIFKVLIAMIMSIMCFGIVNASAEAVFLGDVDLNGKVNAIDARKVLRHAASLEMLDDSVLIRADVNFDKKINSSDARLVLRVASQLDKFEMSDDLLVEQVELGILQGIHIVLQAHIFGAEGLIVEEAGVNCVEHRVKGEHAEDDHSGGNKDIAPLVIAGEDEFALGCQTVLCGSVHILPPGKEIAHPTEVGWADKSISRACRQRSCPRRSKRRQPRRCSRRLPERWPHQPAAAGTWAR